MVSADDRLSSGDCLHYSKALDLSGTLIAFQHVSLNVEFDVEIITPVEARYSQPCHPLVLQARHVLQLAVLCATFDTHISCMRPMFDIIVELTR